MHLNNIFFTKTLVSPKNYFLTKKFLEEKDPKKNNFYQKKISQKYIYPQKTLFLKRIVTKVTNLICEEQKLKNSNTNKTPIKLGQNAKP